MSRSVAFGLSVHEAGHWVAALLLGASPTEVVIGQEKMAVLADSWADHDARILAVGYAAELLIKGSGRATYVGSGDAEKIRRLGMEIEEAIAQALALLKEYEHALLSVAFALMGTIERGEERMETLHLLPFFELARENREE